MKRFLTPFALLLVFLTGCDSFSLNEADPAPAVKESIGIEPGTDPINANQAACVALMFDNDHGRPATKSGSAISDIYTVYDDEGTAVFYAVNRPDNAGYVIVGASRKYFPILAYVEKGHFDDSYTETGIASWVNEQTSTISMIEKHAESGQEEAGELDFEGMWKAYEKKAVLPTMLTKSAKEDDAFSLRQSSVAAWQAEGYTCYDLMEQPKFLPSEIYDYWRSYAASFANQNYDPMVYSVILEKRVDTVKTIGPLIGTTWGQTGGYAAAIPGNRYVGCVPVAVGQIMWYHRWPVTFAWPDMPANSPNSTTADFLYTLGKRMNINYNGNSSSASNGDAEDALKFYNYSTAIGFYDESIISSNITVGRPVYIYGEVAQSGHAWVCEGTRDLISHYGYQLMILSDVEPPLQYVNWVQPYDAYAGTTTYLYHNLGYEGDGNGWYVGKNIYFDHETFKSTFMIYNIRKNN